MSLLRLAALLAAAVLPCCDEPAAAGTSDAAPPAPSAPAPSSRPSPTASSAAPQTHAELKVRKLVLTSEVKKKEPVDKLEAAKPGQRVWAHVTVRNRCPDTKTIKLAFKVAGDDRSTVDLVVAPAWSYRTWGYVTLRPTDVAGEIVVEVRDEGGEVLERARLPIKAKP